jgi:hypothetical protein
MLLRRLDFRARLVSQRAAALRLWRAQLRQYLYFCTSKASN